MKREDSKQWDPFECIPSADAIRRKLEQTKEMARKLAILLETAERIEQETSKKADA